MKSDFTLLITELPEGITISGLRYPCITCAPWPLPQLGYMSLCIPISPYIILSQDTITYKQNCQETQTYTHINTQKYLLEGANYFQHVEE